MDITYSDDSPYDEWGEAPPSFNALNENEGEFKQCPWVIIRNGSVSMFNPKAISSSPLDINRRIEHFNQLIADSDLIIDKIPRRARRKRVHKKKKTASTTSSA